MQHRCGDVAVCVPLNIDFPGRLRCGEVLRAFLAMLLILTPALLAAQDADAEKPVPILTGSAGFFTDVNGGETQLVPVVTLVLLVPLGERWLIESRAEFEGEFERKEGDGP